MRKKRLNLLLISVGSFVCGLVLLCLLAARYGSSAPVLYVNGSQALQLTTSWSSSKSGIEADSWGALYCEYDKDHTADARSWKPIRLRNQLWLGVRRSIAVEYYLVEDTQAPEDDPERFIANPSPQPARWSPTGRLLAPPITGRYVADIQISYWGPFGAGIVHYGVLIDVN